MKMSFFKSVFFVIALVFGLSMILAAQTQQFNKSSGISETPQTVKAKRKIIKLLLTDFFKNSSGKEIYISNKNIPAEIQNEFPKIKNITAKLVESSSATAENPCIFEFKSFSLSEEKALVSFGDCKNGLGYTFQKMRGKWKLVPNQIVNQN